MKTWVTAFFFVICSLAFANSNEPNPKFNTAGNVSYLSPIEKEVIYEINLFRSNPAKYAENYIAPLAKNYKGKILSFPNQKPVMTKEGIRALNECVRELKREKPLPLLYPKAGLSKAAKDHVSDQSKTGKTGHTGRDRSEFRQRIERHGNWQGRIAENIAYGGFSARQTVIFLLIDDDVPDRGHRKNFLHPGFNNIGVAAGKHPEYITMCVMEFAGGFTGN